MRKLQRVTLMPPRVLSRTGIRTPSALQRSDARPPSPKPQLPALIPRAGDLVALASSAEFCAQLFAAQDFLKKNITVSYATLHHPDVPRLLEKPGDLLRSALTLYAAVTGEAKDLRAYGEAERDCLRALALIFVLNDEVQLASLAQEKSCSVDVLQVVLLNIQTYVRDHFGKAKDAAWVEGQYPKDTATAGQTPTSITGRILRLFTHGPKMQPQVAYDKALETLERRGSDNAWKDITDLLKIAAEQNHIPSILLLAKFQLFGTFHRLESVALENAPLRREKGPLIHTTLSWRKPLRITFNAVWKKSPELLKSELCSIAGPFKNTEALFLLACCETILENHSNAQATIREAADIGHGLSAFLHAQHLDPETHPEDYIHYLEIAARGHVPQAFRRLALIYSKGRCGQKPDQAKAYVYANLYLYCRADDGFDPSLYNSHRFTGAAERYLSALPVADREVARRRLAQELTHFAKRKADNPEGKVRDFSEAKPNVQTRYLAALQGAYDNNLWHMAEFGRILLSVAEKHKAATRDRLAEEAVTWLEKAVAGGNTRAARYLADAFHNGRVLNTNNATAAHFYEIAATTTQDTQAMKQLTMLHATGKMNSEVDVVAALTWDYLATYFGDWQPSPLPPAGSSREKLQATLAAKAWLQKHWAESLDFVDTTPSEINKSSVPSVVTNHTEALAGLDRFLESLQVSCETLDDPIYKNLRSRAYQIMDHALLAFAKYDPLNAKITRFALLDENERDLLRILALAHLVKHPEIASHLAEKFSTEPEKKARTLLAVGVLIADLQTHIRENLGENKSAPWFEEQESYEHPKVYSEHQAEVSTLDSFWHWDRTYSPNLPFETCMAAARAGFPKAMFDAGMVFIFGHKDWENLPTLQLKGGDFEQGMAWLDLAANHGDTRALLALGLARYSQEKRLFEKFPHHTLSQNDRSQILRYFERAVENGVPQGLETLSRIYAEGFLVIRDEQRSADYAKKAQAKKK